MTPDDPRLAHDRGITAYTDSSTTGNDATNAAPTGVAPGPGPTPTRPATKHADTVVPVTARRYRETITTVDLWAVLKISLSFYVAAMAITCVALLALWLLADAAGVRQSVEKFMGSLLQSNHFTFVTNGTLVAVLLLGAVIVVLQTIVTVIAAAFYNLFASLFGGVELTISEDETFDP